MVSDGLRTIFKQEWDSRYQATLGAWNNTAINGREMHNIEKRGPGKKENLPKFLNGNINEWDCTVLFNAILYSNSIGRAGLNPTIQKEVDILRQMRNKISHLPQDQLSEREFENDSEAVRKSFLALGLSTKRIDDIKTERKLVASFKVLPSHPTHEVIYRTATASAIIDDLENLKKKNNEELTFFYISGNPGSGKSQLASQIGKSLYEEKMKKQNELTFVMTLNAESLDTLLQSYEDFARRTDIPDDIITSILNTNQTKDGKIRSLRTKIAARMEIYKNWLVIVDNVVDVKLVSPLLPERINDKWNGGQVLITTQESSLIPLSNSFTGNIEISPGLDEKESCELLTQLSGNDMDSHHMLKNVAKELDYQPLALAAAAVYIRQVRETKVSPEFSWHDYLQKLDEGKRQLTEKVLEDTNMAYSYSMTTAVLLAVEKAAENNIILKYTFHFLSLASHESLPLEVAINHVLSVDKNQDKEQVGLTIRKCSLILPDDEVNKVVFVRLHRVIHEAIKVYAQKREMEEICNSIELAATLFYKFMNHGSNDKTLVPHLKAFHDAMFKMFPNSKTLYSENPNSEIGEIFSYFGTVLKKYGNFISAKGFYATDLFITEKFRGSNHVDVAMSYNNLGNVHKALGNFQEAKQYHEKALNIRTEQLGSKHVDVATSYHNLGNVHADLGDFQVAKKCYEKSLNIRTEQLGSNHVDVAMSYNNLGTVHQNLGHFQEAKQYHQKALNLCTQQLRSNHIDMATFYNNLGNVHADLGDFQEAKQYHEKALNIRTEQLGSNHVDVAMSYNNIGTVHRDLGDFQEAKQYHEKALNIRTEQLGSNHVKVAMSYNNLGTVHQDLGDLQQAKQYYEKALDVYTEQLGSNHVDVAMSYNNLGNVHKALGHFQEAKQFHEKALNIRTEQLGSNHVDVAASYNNLGNVHADFGDCQEAKQCYEKALNIRTEQLGSNHVDVAMSYNNLGNVHADLGDFQKAKQYHEKALNIRTEQLGSNHVDVAMSYNNLGTVHQDLGDFQETKQYYQKALSIRTKQLGANHVDVAMSNNNLGTVHHDLGDFQEAKRYYEKAVDIYTEQLGSNHVDVAMSYNNLGTVRLDLGDFQEAKQYYEKALNIRTEQLGSNHVGVAMCYDNLGNVHANLGHIQQAKQYYENALNIRTEQFKN